MSYWCIFFFYYWLTTSNEFVTRFLLFHTRYSLIQKRVSRQIEIPIRIHFLLPQDFWFQILHFWDELPRVDQWVHCWHCICSKDRSFSSLSIIAIKSWQDTLLCNVPLKNIFIAQQKLLIVSLHDLFKDFLLSLHQFHGSVCFLVNRFVLDKV